MSTKQRRLKKGRKIKAEIARELGAIKKGEKSIRDVLRSPTPAMQRVTIYNLIKHVPGIGEARAKKILQAEEIWPEDRLGKLSYEDRSRIAKHFEDQA